MTILHNTQRTQSNTIFETILYSLLISGMTYIAQYTFDFTAPLSKYQDSIRRLFYRKYTLHIEGITSTATSMYTSRSRVTNMYTDNFKAVWDYILSRLPEIRSIYEIREVATTRYQVDDTIQDKYNGMFVVSQRERFLLDADLEIYAITNQRTEESEQKVFTRTNSIEITLYSYKSNTQILKQFVENITRQYIVGLTDSRVNKRFLYSLIKPQEEDSNAVWSEAEFHSSKTFDNVFFDHKHRVLDQIDFFLNNRDWYDTYGIPYTLGIGIYGPPGTGKTSFIKALMNHVNDRHLVNMSLSLIRTKTQLYEYYYESRFSENNTPNSVGFDKKIIVIEDIDCAGEIVMERGDKERTSSDLVECLDSDFEEVVSLLNKNTKHGSSQGGADSVGRNKSAIFTNGTFGKRDEVSHENKTGSIHLENETRSTEPINMGTIRQVVKENIVAETQRIMSKLTEDRITLDDILNLWDGLRETPGRILVITSNHYDKLDAAIRRPGRIDITLGLENASRETIAEMFFHFYQKPINGVLLSKIESRLYSPAQIVNLYTAYKNDADGFVKRLATNTTNL